MGSRRREVLLSKVVAFIKRRATNAQELDSAVFRLAISAKLRDDSKNPESSWHSVDCWHISRHPQCTCLDEYVRYIAFYNYRAALANSALFQDAKSQLVENTDAVDAKDFLYVLRFFLSLSKTSRRATELSAFVSM